MSKILNPSQAEAVYRAMVALNNVYGRVYVKLPSPKLARVLQVKENSNGTVVVGYGLHNAATADVLESYTDQNEFCAAYALDAVAA